jgi:hypothetical protein
MLILYAPLFIWGFTSAKKLTVEELQEQNIIDLADAKVLDKANSMIDPLFDLGEPHVFDPDIAGGTII